MEIKREPSCRHRPHGRRHRGCPHPSADSAGEARTQGAQCRPRARAVRGRLVLVGGDCAASGSRPECHIGAKSTHHLGRQRRRRAARARSAGWPDRSGRTLLLRHDRHPGRDRSKGRVPGLCRGTRPRRPRGLYRARQAFPHPAGVRRHRLDRRLGPAQRGRLPARFRG